MKVHVFRLSHRAYRDKRISTHCALVSRAFGAGRIIYSGERDHAMEDSIRRMVKQWGGPFGVEYSPKKRDVLKEYRSRGWKIVHLTMYGLRFEKEISKIRMHENILLVFGGEKVPMEIYHEADYNIAVTGQPHSEVAAIAIFLDGYFQGKQYSKPFPGGKMIVPQKCGKKFKT